LYDLQNATNLKWEDSFSCIGQQVEAFVRLR
jgi:hypothetical protein